MIPATTPALVAIASLVFAKACEPTFTKPADVKIDAAQVAVFTHCSAHFDPLGQTTPAVRRVARTMKQRGLPILYFHDRYNSSNPAWKYLYSDREPTAYIASDIGHYNIESQHIRHVILLGGYYWACHKNTVRDALRLWRRDAREHDLRITIITDGIFDVIEGVRPGDPYRTAVREYFYGLRERHPKATVSLESIAQLIDDDEAELAFVRRQLPPMPAGINVQLDYFGLTKSIRKASSSTGRPTLTIAYRRSHDFLLEPSAAESAED